jgi:hypothetical protein
MIKSKLWQVPQSWTEYEVGFVSLAKCPFERLGQIEQRAEGKSLMKKCVFQPTRPAQMPLRRSELNSLIGEAC